MGINKRTILTGDLRGHPAVRAWSMATSLNTVPERLHVYRERPRRALYRLPGVAPDGASVFAKRAVAPRTVIERTIYRDVLPWLPLTAPRYLGSWLDESDGWLFVEDVGGTRYCEQESEHLALAARWVATLHAGAAAIPAARTLPDGGPARYLAHLRTARDKINSSLARFRYPADEAAALSAVLAQCDAVEAQWGRIEEAATDGAPATVVHGDFRAKNGYLRRNGDGLSLLPIDWETAGWGAPAPDLTRIDLRVYWSVVREAWPRIGYELIESWQRIARLLEELAAVNWVSETLKCDSARARTWAVEDLKVVLKRMSAAARAAGVPESPRRGRAAGATGDATAVLGRPAAAEVGRLLGRGAGPAAGGLAVDLEQLEGNRATYRVSMPADGARRSLIVKQVDADVARRNRLVARRWLPWLGLDDLAPALLGAAAGADAESVWQIYEDVGGTTLHEHRGDRLRVAAAVQRLAELHVRAAGHPVVAECRRHGRDLGLHYFTSNVGDAARLLEALRPPEVRANAEQSALRDRLRRRLEPLLADVPRRAALIEEAGPETMLHGDPWTTNVLLPETGDRTAVRLVDWDRAGAGPFCYDLSLLLYRFEPADRPWLVDRYRDAVACAGWHLPPAPELDVLLRSFECARYANRIVWPAIALLREAAAWSWPELARVDGWFEALETATTGCVHG